MQIIIVRDKNLCPQFFLSRNVHSFIRYCLSIFIRRCMSRSNMSFRMGNSIVPSEYFIHFSFRYYKIIDLTPIPSRQIPAPRRNNTGRGKKLQAQRKGEKPEGGSMTGHASPARTALSSAAEVGPQNSPGVIWAPFRRICGNASACP